MTARRVLITGASVAGPALAYWLRRYGWEPVILERAGALREGGQNVDLRGAARVVARRMALEAALLAANTGEQGLRFVDRDGAAVAEFPAGHSDTDGATAEVEILRGDLARLLYDRTRERVEYRFGDRIAGIAQDADGVTVSFGRGDEERFDLVVAAEGLSSTTRALVFGDEPTIKALGLYTAYYTIPRAADDDAWWRWYVAPGGRSIHLRPDNVGTTRVVLTFRTAPRDAARRDEAGQRQLLRETFRDAGWVAPRVVGALDDADDLYCEALAQVRAPHWSRGRVALAGDAAHCASPISGMGTSLALVGAYVLAGELAAHVHHRDAFRGYERIMRPYVEQAQQLPPGTPRLANPIPRLGVTALNAALGVAARPALRRLGGRFFSPPAAKIDLPDYAHLLVP